jgi:hypothetical protein
MRLFCGWFLGLAVFAWPLAVSAQPSTTSASLKVSGQTGTKNCLSAKELEAAVEQRLARDVFPQSGTLSLAVSVHFTHEAGAFLAVITLSDTRGRALGVREIQTPAQHCSALDESLPLVVALLVDSPPEPIESETEPAPSPPVTPTQATPPAPAKPDTVRLSLPEETHAPRTPVRWDVSVSALASLGGLPGVGLGLELGIGADIPAVTRLRAFVDGYLPNREPRDDRPSAGVEVSLVRVGLELCPLETAPGTLVILGCVGQALTRTHAEGFGFYENSSATRLLYGLFGRAAGLLDLGRGLHLRASLGVDVPLQRSNYAFVGADGTSAVLFRSPPVGGAAELGAGLSFE